MTAEEQFRRRTERESKGEVMVVDLSERPSGLERLAPVHRKILESLRRAAAGLLGRDELLDDLRGYSFSDVEQALRDLTIQGSIKVLWRTPFRFIAYLTERGRKADLSLKSGVAAVAA